LVVTHQLYAACARRAPDRWRMVIGGVALAFAAPAVAQNLDARLTRVEDMKAIERLQNAYGYYQNRFLFTEPPTLFSSDRPEVHYDGGVWIGKASVQRLWQRHFPAVFGTDGKGPRAGVMFDQPMFQAVVDVAEDGRTAKARFQTIGRFASYGQDERWVGGVFENDYVKEGGIWKIKVLRYCSSWDAPYNRGWKDGVSSGPLPWTNYAKAGRPDRIDKSACPRVYPEGGAVTFRYLHPVTGKPVAQAGGGQ